MVDILYPCDPNKNVACNKRGCFINGGPCQETRHFEYADVRSVAFPKKLFQEQRENVKAIRCKNCKYMNDDGNCTRYADEGAVHSTLPDGFCWVGEPKMDEVEE